MSDVGAQEYECRGGPRDGSWRGAKDGTRFYVLVKRQPDGQDPLTASTIESIVPTPGPAWTPSGWYDLTRITTKRFGSRTVWQWHAMTPWPVWLGEVPKPFRPDPPKPLELPPGEYRSDEDG